MKRSRLVCLALGCLVLCPADLLSTAGAQDGGSRRWGRPDRRDDRDRDRDRDDRRDGRRDDRDRRDGDRDRRRPPVARAVRVGTTVSRLPRGVRDVDVRGRRYYVHEGTVYSRGSRPDTYVVVRPPPGVVVSHLPSDYVSLQIGGLSFFYHDDTYYNDRLEVVDTPIGGTLTYLPDGYDTVEVRGGRYYRHGDRYFKPLLRAGRTVYQRVDFDPRDLRPAEWEPLGSAKISFRGELESIPSSLRRGRFRQMRVEVTGGDVEIYDIGVRFANGEVFSPNIRQNFDENTRSRTIDLPGDERFIKEVVFRARSRLSLAGKATISIWVR